MTDTAKCFVSLIQSICWTKGWGTSGITERYPKYDTVEADSLKWLETNGYVFHITKDVYNKHRNWRYAHHTAEMYGLTKKGWSVAKKFINASGTELCYQFDYLPKMPL